MGSETNSAAQVVRILDSAREAASGDDYVGARAEAHIALTRARRAREFGLMVDASAIYLRACEMVVERAHAAGDGALIIARGADAPDPLVEGCYLLQPPMIGADATRLRDAAFAGGLAVRALAREPLTREGKWPVVAVGDVIVRAHVDPPVPLERVEGVITKDEYPGPAPLDWFHGAIDALGREALASLNEEDPAQHRVDDLLELLTTIPDHSGIVGALRDACEDARTQPTPTLPRRRPVVDDPYSF